MTEDDRRRTRTDERTKHVARVDLDAREAAARDQAVEKDPVSDIERDGPELLDRLPGKPGSHVRPHL